jgi:hypothetical protein
MPEKLTATISVGATRQIRQYEPINGHISIQGVTAETTPEAVRGLLRGKVKELFPEIAEAAYAMVTAEMKRLRGDEVGG